MVLEDVVGNVGGMGRADDVVCRGEAELPAGSMVAVGVHVEGERYADKQAQRGLVADFIFDDIYYRVIRVEYRIVFISIDDYLILLPVAAEAETYIEVSFVVGGEGI